MWVAAESARKIADARGPPREPAYTLAASAAAGRTAATRPACIHNYIMLWGELLNGSCTLSPDPSDDMDEE
jgi:hypothetical protein